MFLSMIFLATAAFIATLVGCAPPNANSSEMTAVEVDDPILGRITLNYNVSTEPVIPDLGLVPPGRYCHYWSMQSYGSSASPLVSDCQVIARNIANGGTWTIVSGQQRTLVTFGSCAYGVKADFQMVSVSYLDIIDMINGSIKFWQFQDNGAWKVGTGGNLECQVDCTGTWGLYHTK